MATKYAVHAVKATRNGSSPTTHEGYDYEKGALLRTTSIDEGRAKLFNEQAHHSGEMYYALPVEEVVAPEPETAEPAETVDTKKAKKK